MTAPRTVPLADQKDALDALTEHMLSLSGIGVAPANVDASTAQKTAGEILAQALRVVMPTLPTTLRQRVDMLVGLAYERVRAA